MPYDMISWKIILLERGQAFYQFYTLFLSWLSVLYSDKKVITIPLFHCFTTPLAEELAFIALLLILEELIPDPRQPFQQEFNCASWQVYRVYSLTSKRKR